MQRAFARKRTCPVRAAFSSSLWISCFEILAASENLDSFSSVMIRSWRSSFSFCSSIISCCTFNRCSYSFFTEPG
uniref:Putative secreted protein n=1 Tax=Anopheles darlingi TaxID=43151 RepID=A0A2M4D8K3_ANODA